MSKFVNEEVKIQRMYFNQLKSSEERGHKPPEYSFDEFRAWVLQQEEWPTLISEYLLSYKCSKPYKNRGYPCAYNPDISPSVDRIDSTLPYSFDNIKLTTWKQNQLNHIEDTKRPVNQYTMEGVYIRTFESITSAAEFHKSHNISAACKGFQNSSKGYQFRFLDESLGTKNIGRCVKPTTVSKSINMYHLTGEYITTFKSASEASRLTGVPRRNIASVASFSQKSVYGFLFRFENNRYPIGINIKGLGNVTIFPDTHIKILKVLECLNL